jgi:hypothetical protein
MNKVINDRYFINEFGEIYSNYYFTRRKKKIIGIYKINTYLLDNQVNVSISINGENPKPYRVSHLVLKYFKVLPPDINIHWMIGYKDNDRTNCSVENLYYRPRKFNLELNNISLSNCKSITYKCIKCSLYHLKRNMISITECKDCYYNSDNYMKYLIKQNLILDINDINKETIQLQHKHTTLWRKLKQIKLTV